MYENAAQDSRYAGAASQSGKTTAVWFANENDRLIKTLSELMHDRLSKVLPAAVPEGGAVLAKAETSAYANSEFSQQLRDQNERLSTLIRLIEKVDL